MRKKRLAAVALLTVGTLLVGPAATIALAGPGNLGPFWRATSDLLAAYNPGPPPADLQSLLGAYVPPPAFPLGIPVDVTRGLSPVFGALAGPGATSNLAPLPGLGDLPEFPSP